MEHRWGERFAVDIMVRVGSRPYAVRNGRLTDLSMSGGSIKIGSDLRVLSRVQVALVLPARFSHATPVPGWRRRRMVRFRAAGRG
jgi:hypothetical protein